MYGLFSHSKDATSLETYLLNPSHTTSFSFKSTYILPCYAFEPVACSKAQAMPFLLRIKNLPFGVAVWLKIALMTVLMLVLLHSQAAVVVLDNGDRLSGELVSLSANVLVLKSAIYGELELPWKKVVELSSDDAVVVQLTDGSISHGRVSLSQQGLLVIEPGDLEPSSFLQKSDVALFNPPVIDRVLRLEGRASLGGVFNRGNSEDDSVSFDTEIVARTPDHRYTLAAEVNEAESNGISTTSNRALSVQYDTFLSEKEYLFLNARGERDQLADLELRSSVGGGYGYQFFENDRAKLSTEYGLAYIKEEYQLAPDESFPSLSLGLNYERKFWKRRLVFFNTNDLLVSLEDAADSSAKMKWGIRVPIVDNVNVATQLNMAYDNMPPPGIKKTDTSLVFNVGLGF
jgi:putative salt-induced outer membrane protein YdiY